MLLQNMQELSKNFLMESLLRIPHVNSKEHPELIISSMMFIRKLLKTLIHLMLFLMMISKQLSEIQVPLNLIYLSQKLLLKF